MQLSTQDQIVGQEIIETLGLVRGNTVRSRNIGRDITALFRNVVGGEIVEYTKMMAESREQALDRLIKQAEELGANAIVGIRFTSASVMTNAAEKVVYGTAVKLS